MRDLDSKRLPSHVGIIMDGNGRWARMRNLPRSAGHREGLKAAKRIVRAAAELGIPYLTLYTFSTENWKRAKDEVSFLMRLIRMHLRKEWDFYRENHIRVIHSGDLARLPPSIQREIESVVQDTRDFDRLVLNLAINYGGRDELVRGLNRWIREHPDLAGERAATSSEPEQGVSDKDVREFLDHPELPDADLIIRTGGEQRLSNFLLWQSAYAEFYFSPKLWPDWDTEDLLEAVRVFQLRHRRYGAVPEEAGSI